MGNKKFLARLAKELPDWAARGWVKAGAERAILEHVAAQGGGTPLPTYAFSILGVLLFGSGILVLLRIKGRVEFINQRTIPAEIA